MQTGYPKLTRTLEYDIQYGLAAEAFSTWIDSLGSNFCRSARLIIAWASADAQNNIYLYACNEEDRSDTVVVELPTPTNASQRILIVELPTSSYRYFQVQNHEGAATLSHILLERYNPRKQADSGTEISTTGNIYYPTITGDEEAASSG